MIFDAVTLVRNARSIADLQDTQFVTYEDIANSLNEGYREIYNKYTESDSDFWIAEVVIEPTAEMVDPNANNAYLIPLPDDFYKLRTVSWSNGQWLPMNRFSMSERDSFTGIPMYSLRNNYLWVIGQGLGQIKLAYYTPMETVTVPAEPSPLTPESVSQMRNVTSMFWDEPSGTLFYIYSQAMVKSYSPASGTTSSLYVSANVITGISYAGGHVYFLDTFTNRIISAPLAATLVPASLAPTNVINFRIFPTTGKIYYATASATFSATLTGSGSVEVLAATSSDYLVYQGTPCWIASGLVVVDSVASAVTAVRLLTDDVWLYVLDSNGTLSRYSLVDDVMTLSDTVASSLSQIGSGVSFSTQRVPQSPDFGALWLPAPFVPTLDFSYQAVVQSLTRNSVFDYPTIEVNELMSYQMAVYFLRKQTDQAKLVLVAASLERLWQRFYTVNKRDENQSARINNSYSPLGGGWGWY